MSSLKKVIWLQLLLLFVISSNKLHGQAQILQFDQTSVDQILKTIEGQSEYIFNFDPILIRDFHFSGKVNVDNIQDLLIQVLYKSPFAFEVNGNNILVYQEDEKLYTICGRLIDATTQEPLINASIIAIQTSLGVQTDEFGYFSFDINAQKNEIIKISYLGYEPITFMVQDFKTGDCPSYPMIIDEDIFNGVIVITDYVLDGISQGEDYDALIMDFEKLSQNHSTVEHDILKTAQLLPGINSIDGSATNLQIRGSSPSQNLLLWEGATIYNAGHIFGMISAINPFSVESVNIYKGAHDPKYDNRVGGIIDISLSDTVDSSFHGSVGTTLTEVHANLEIPIIKNRLGILLGGRQSLKNLLNSPTLQSYTNQVFQYSIVEDQSQEIEEGLIFADQNLNYSDWNGKLLFQATDKIRLSLGAYHNEEDFEYGFSFLGDTYNSRHNILVETNVINADIDVKHNDKWTSKLSWFKSTYENNYKITELEDDLVSNEINQLNSVQEQSVSLSSFFYPKENLSFNIGYELNRKQVILDFDEDINSDPDFPSKSNEQIDFQNLFMSSRYVVKKLKIEGGIRTTFLQDRKKWLHSPRVSLHYPISHRIKLKADLGIYNQLISQIAYSGSQQIRVDNPLWILNTSNSQLSQQANKIAFGCVYKRGSWILDIEAFHNRITGINTLSPNLNEVADIKGISNGRSTVKGIDFLIKKRWSSFNAWINYSFGVAEYNFPEISPNNFKANNDIRHNLNLITNYSIRNLQFSLNTSYHSGLPYSRPELVFNEDEPDAEPPFLYYLGYDELNNFRLADYMRVDFNVNYRIQFKRFKNFKSEISFSIINLLERRNEFSRSYFLDYNENTEIYSSAFVNKILLDRTPLLLFRIYW